MAHGPEKARDAMQVLRRRVATGIGAVLLGLVAIALAKLGDEAQHLFARFSTAWPYAALLLTPTIFAATVYLTQRWAPLARGSGIPQVIAASANPADSATSPLVSLKTGAIKC